MAPKDTSASYREALTGALQKIKRLQASEAKLRSEPIAVVSMACRFPGGAVDPEGLWEILDQGRDAITEIPASRFDVDAYFDPDPDAAGKIYTRWGGFVGEVDHFDASFFGISPREAKRIDPQERLLLETTWELFERIGIVPATLAGSRTGVYLGISSNDYLFLDGMNEAEVDAYSILGTAHSAVAGRLSYWLGLEGPNLPVDTACSSSLVSLHLACQALRHGDCDTAISGGVNLLLSSYGFVYFSRLKAMSPTGRCHTFSKDADGYVRSEGCGLLLLKRLSDAQRDGDEVLAVIRGSAVNQDGQSNGFTAPNGPAQQAVIRRALEVANLEPNTIDYVECHGTGTALGDPIEVQALAAVYGQERKSDAPVLLGSIKSNIGHAESAAGVAGVIKAVLALRHRTIPKTLHASDENPHIPWSDLPVRVAREPSDWFAGDTPRRAAVSAFGFSGTNAHVILEEAPDEAPAAASAAEAVSSALLLSGQTPRALAAQAARMASWLSEQPDARWSAIVQSAAYGRTHFETRSVILVDNPSDATEGLEALAAGRGHANLIEGEPSVGGKIAFLFTGQGSQTLGMGRMLYDTLPVFKESFDGLCAVLDAHLERSLKDVVFADAGGEHAALIDETAYTQPALFALEVALVDLWASYGVRPDWLMGHSIGELAAAHVAGVLTLEDAAKLVCARGRLMQACVAGGAMASIQATESEVRTAIKAQDGPLDVAGINGPEQVVISGDEAALELVRASFEADGRRTKRLTVSHAFHSSHIDSMLAEFEAVAQSVSYCTPEIPMVSNVTGTPIDSAMVTTASYWVRHVREAVRFADGVTTLVDQGVRAFVECGPGGVLSAMGVGCVSADSGAHFIASMRRDTDEVAAFTRAVAQVHVVGQSVDWQPLVGARPPRLVGLPTYAFQREYYWLDTVKTSSGSSVAKQAPVRQPAEPVSSLSADLLALPEEVRRRELQEVMREETALVLGAVDPSGIAERKGFMELGFDSLMAVELQKRLQKRMGITIPATLAFDHPSIVDATAWLADALSTAEPLAAEVRDRGASLDEPLAIVGVGLKLPGGATDLDSLWAVLSEERDALVDIPQDRFHVGSIYDPDPDAKGKTYVQRAALIDDVASFDSSFFGISPREADPLDPQHRLLLETAWVALENAGLPPGSLRGSSTGVFVGIGANEYADYRGRSSDESDAYDATGHMTSFAAGRVAYHLGLQGPTLALDTACSSSLVALHLAGASLRRGDCDVALACGVQVVASPMGFVLMSRTQALAPDGRSKTFSEAANGYGRGEGVGVLVLMRKSDAQASGRPILGLVRGSAINHDGPSSGITAPNGTSQQKVLRAALRDAGLGPMDVDTIECHGTGTRLGDPIEVQALAAVYATGRDDTSPLRLGSVKTNLGHLEAAAGVAAVLKVLASMRYETQPAALHTQPLNTHIPWDDLDVKVVDEAMAWSSHDRDAPLRAGISSFGMSGTNAHVIIEAAPTPASRLAATSTAPGLLVLSGQTEGTLREQALRWQSWLAEHPDVSWHDVTHTAATTRTHFETRAAIVAHDVQSALAVLEDVARGTSSRDAMCSVGSRSGKLAFLFTGQGSQTAGMGQELYEGNAFFRETLDGVAAALDVHLDNPILDVMFGAEGSDASELLGQTAYTQPALFAMEVSLARLWQALGIYPHVLLGHSIGELTAAHIAGVLSLEDAAKLVCARGRLMQACESGGAMASIQGSEAEVREVLDAESGRVDIAGLNGPRQTVISGDGDGVARVMEAFAAKERKCTTLAVSHAFHSAHMDGMLEAFEEVAQSCTFSEPTIPIVSNVTGGLALAEDLQSPAYWVRHVRGAVRFVDGMQALVEFGVESFVECGPRGVLSAMGAGCIDDESVRFIASHRKPKGEHATLSRALGQVYAAGYELDWTRAFHGCEGAFVELPTYAFQRRRYWLEPSSAGASPGGFTKSGHPLLGVGAKVAGTDVMMFSQTLSRVAPAWVADHVVLEQTLLPGAAFMEMMRAAGAAASPGVRSSLTEGTIQKPLMLDDGAEVQVQVTVGEPDASGARSVQVYSLDEDSLWSLHAEGKLTEAAEPTWDVASQLPPEASEGIDVDDMYQLLADNGLGYGPMFQGVSAVWRNGDEVWAQVALPEGAASDAALYGLHPALLDACFHTIAFASQFDDEEDNAFLPFGLERLELAKVGETSLWLRVSEVSASREVLRANLHFFDASGAPVGMLEGLQVKRADTASLQKRPGAGAARMRFGLAWERVDPTDEVAEPSLGLWSLPRDHGSRDSVMGSLTESGWSVTPVDTLDGLAETGIDTLLCLWPTDGEVVSTADEVSTAGLAQLQWMSDGWSGRLIWITSDAVAVADEDRLEGIGASVLWGLGRTASSENPELALTLVDAPREELSAAMLGQLLAHDHEPELAFRGGELLAARLNRVRDDRLQLPSSGDWRLEVAQKGRLDRFDVISTAADDLPDGHVRVRIEAAGVNFRDVLNALGMVPIPWLGLELAGTIEEVGAGVSNVAVGDRVLGIGQATFASSAIADARLVTPIVGQMSVEEAATIPLVFLTAWYALHDLGSLQAGERVLIHAAAGGVGMAAVQLAQLHGAEVFGTASLPKWDVLREMGLDDAHIASSRELSFAPAFRESTGGEGVDVVLNALAREFIDESFGLLRAGGRFLEMGKTDVREQAWVEKNHPGMMYASFDLMEAGQDRIQAMLSSLSELFERGAIKPLPHLTFPMSRIAHVFRYMAQAKHIGKLVLSNAEEAQADLSATTVLVTGGLGDLGAQVARWLVESRGVGHVLLTSRRGNAAPGADTLAGELRALGAEVTIAACDVAKRESLESVIGAIPADYPLRGVVHAAGLLDDGVLATLTPERMAKVFAPKVSGGWYLHQLTESMQLEFFVTFSSISSVVGGVGQGNYAAANAFLDALAQHRLSSGLAGTSVAWGPWAEGGMAAAMAEADKQRMQRQGMDFLSNEHGMALLEGALSYEGGLLVAMALDTRRLGRSFERGGMGVTPIFKSLVQLSGGPLTTGGLKQTLVQLSEPDRPSALLEVVRGEVARILGLGSGRDVDPGRSLQELGVDSLMGVELRHRLAALSELKLPATLVFDYPTADSISGFVLSQLDLSQVVSKASPQVHVAGARCDEPIAIVSMACRFPGGVEEPEALWSLLSRGEDAITEVPPLRFDIDAIFDPDPDATGKTYTRWGGFVGDVTRFDASFFGISPREAKSIDPQERLLLESTWELFERAGIVPSELSGSDTGVYIGISGNEYLGLSGMDLNDADAYSILGTTHSAVAGRISYWLGLEGPNMPIDTACSSSLVSLHLACQGLRLGECSMAVAGGVNLLLSPYGYVYFSRLKAMSPTGRCHTFSKDADGYVRAEGCGLLLLKRLSDAQRDGDEILGVVRGSAVNQDGQSNGFTAPNGPAQQTVIRRALAMADVPGESIDYVECHGTGTSLGDPIEVQALAAVYGEGRPTENPVTVGSIKSNIGHTESAAGVAGVIKAILSMQHGEIPQSLHAGELNPHIPWDDLPVQVAAHARPWQANGTPRRAGVSSFGFSGTNAHVILEEAPKAEHSEERVVAVDPESIHPIVLSGQSVEAVVGQAHKLQELLEAEHDVSLVDLALSLATSRTHFSERLVLRASSREGLLAKLAQVTSSGDASGTGLLGTSGSTVGKTALLFTGQGSQRVGMGRGLYQTHDGFRERLDAIAAVMDAHLDAPLLEVMFADDPKQLNQTAYTQPALFALEVALAGLWQSWGVRPDILVGHSIGELAAAHVAGVFSLEDACKLVAARGRLMQALPAGGAMASIGVPVDEVRGAITSLGLDAELSIAGVNAPTQSVVSGSAEAVTKIMGHFEAASKRVKALVVSHAFHSQLMDPMLDDFRAVAESIVYQAPAMGMISNLTGERADERVATADYWVSHVREAVLFCDGIQAAVEAGVEVFLEVGPDPVLSGMGAQCIDTDRDIRWIPSLRRKEDDWQSVLDALGGLHICGLALDWAGYFAPFGAKRVQLPSYAFVRKRYWLEQKARGGALLPGQFQSKTGLGGFYTVQPEGGWQHFVPVGAAHQPYVADHIIHGQVIAAGSFHIGVVLAVAEEHFSETGFVLENIRFIRPLLLEEERVVQVALVPGDDAQHYSFRVLTLDDDEDDGREWMLYVEGSIAVGEGEGKPAESLAELRSLCGEQASVQEHYDELASVHIVWEPMWCWTQQAFSGGEGDGGLVELAPPEGLDAGNAPLHPVVIDNGFAASRFSVSAEGDDDTPQLPFAVDRLCWYQRADGPIWCHTRPIETGEESSRFDLTFWDSSGALVAEFFGYTIKRAPQQAMLANAGAKSADQLTFEVEWIRAAGEGALPEGTWYLWTQGGSRLAKIAEYQLEAMELPVKKVSSMPSPDEAVGSTVLCFWDGDMGAVGQADSVARFGLEQLQQVMGQDNEPKLVWITEGSAPGVEVSQPTGLGASVLWGMARSARNENTDLGLRLIDVAPGDDDLMHILDALALVDEPECLVGIDGVAVPRMVRQSPERSDEPWLSPGGTVLITGGLGALGQEVARWLVHEHEVDHLVLTSRRGMSTPGSSDVIDSLRELGATAVVVACDVTDRAALTAVLADIPEERPLRGVIHTAGILDDGTISELDERQLSRVLMPKVKGGWNLHRLTEDLELDCFILFSSIAGVVGSLGQGNYAAANAFLDALASHRRARGLVGTSIAWGPWAEGGMAAQLGAADQARMQRQGFGSLSMEQGMELLELCGSQGKPLSIALNLDTRRLQRAIERSGTGVPALYRSMIHLSTTSASSANDLRKKLEALPATEQLEGLMKVIRDEIALVLGLKSGREVGEGKSLQDLGIDSLMGVELSKRMAALTGAKLPATLVFDYPTPRAIGEKLLGDLKLSSSDGAGGVDAAELKEILNRLTADTLQAAGLLEPLLALASHEAGDAASDDEAREGRAITAADVDTMSDSEVEDELDAILGEL